MYMYLYQLSGDCKFIVKISVLNFCTLITVSSLHVNLKLRTSGTDHLKIVHGYVYSTFFLVNWCYVVCLVHIV